MDAPDKAQRYHNRADECRRLADIGSSPDIRNHYLRMAEYYTVFAEAEEAKGRDAPASGTLIAASLKRLQRYSPL